MRKMLFRGKRVDNGEWVYGYYVFNGWTDKQKHMIIPNYASALYGFEVIPETVGQFTGLTDKNGTKIFEGDIVEAWSQGVKAKGEVKQRIDGYWLMFPAWKNGKSWSLAPNEKCETTVEVIGNIHEVQHE